MSISNLAIPDFECLGVHNDDASKDVAIVPDFGEPTEEDPDISEPTNEDLTSESDTTEEYSSSDDMVDSTEMSNESLELDIGDVIDTESVNQPLCAGADINTECAQYNSGIPTEIDLDNQKNLNQEHFNLFKEYGAPMFSNLPNLPADGLFGTPFNIEPVEVEEASSLLQSGTVSPANIPNVIEMHSANDSANGNNNSDKRGAVNNMDFLPKLEVITEHFESVFTIGGDDKGSPGFYRSRHNIKMPRKKRTRTKTVQKWK